MNVSKTRQEGEKQHGLSESVWRRKREGVKENLRFASEHVRGVLACETIWEKDIAKRRVGEACRR